MRDSSEIQSHLFLKLRATAPLRILVTMLVQVPSRSKRSLETVFLWCRPPGPWRTAGQATIRGGQRSDHWPASSPDVLSLTKRQVHRRDFIFPM